MQIILLLLVICFCVGLANVFFLACFGIGKLIWTILKYVIPVLLVLLVLLLIIGAVVN